MSTGTLHLPDRPDLFHWSLALDPADYLRATYVVAPFEFSAGHAGIPPGQPRNWRITLAIPLRLSAPWLHRGCRDWAHWHRCRASSARSAGRGGQVPRCGRRAGAIDS